MRIAIASDHTAVDLRRAIALHMTERGHEVIDLGPDSTESTDYAVWGAKAAHEVADGDAERGIVICGTGVGISLAANKIHGIRCACVSEPYSALLSRQHNDANMLAFGARVVGLGLATQIVDAFLDGEFEGGRHARRVEQVMALEDTGI